MKHTQGKNGSVNKAHLLRSLCKARAVACASLRLQSQHSCCEVRWRILEEAQRSVNLAHTVVSNRDPISNEVGSKDPHSRVL